MDYQIHRFNFQDKVIFAFLFSILLIIGHQYSVNGVCGAFHDDAIYVSTAKALAEGKGYRLINLPGSPPQTKYPILYPLLLAMIWKIWPNFPENIFIMQSLSLLLGGLGLGLCYLYLIRYRSFSRYFAFSSCLLCATSPFFLFFATNCLSEIPFFIFILSALWTAEKKLQQSSKDPISDFIRGILLSLPFLCRNMGAVFIISAIIFFYRYNLLTRWIILGVLTTVLPWIIWVSRSLVDSNQDLFIGYYTDYFAWWAKFGLPSFGKIILINFLYVLIGTTFLPFDGFFNLFLPINQTSLPIFIILLATFFGSMPWLLLCKDLPKFNLASLSFIGYLCITICWPWPPSRFLIPILPFIIAGLLYGINLLFLKISRKQFGNVFNASLLLFFIITNLFLVYREIHIQRETGYPGLMTRKTSVSWESYRDLFIWIQRESSPDDIIASGLDSMIYLYTNRQSLRPFVFNVSPFYGQQNIPATGTVRDLYDILTAYRVKFLVHTPMPAFYEEKYFVELLRNMLEQYPNLLFPVYIGKDSRFRIYEVNLNLHPK